MDPVLAIALAGGSVVAVKTIGGEKVAPKATTKPSGAAASKVAFKLKLSTTAASHPGAAGVKNPYVTARPSSFNDTRKGGSQPSEAEQAVTKEAKAAFDKLSSDAKKAACAKLKAAYPNEPSIQAIPCGGGYDAYMKAIAAAGGTAACAATGAGAVVSPLCGIAASWIASWAGPKFKEWGADAYNAGKEALGDVGSGIKSVGSSIVGGIGSLF